MQSQNKVKSYKIFDNKKIKVGTRGSDLARIQTKWVVDSITRIVPVETITKIIKTRGDHIKNLSLKKVEGKGFFTKEIEDALINREIDIAVHSLKDLPVEVTPGLIVAAIPKRENPGELLLIHPDFVDDGDKLGIAKNSIVGTSSLRRITQLHAIRQDLRMQELRGNLTTRIRKLLERQYHAIVIAAAGFNRLGVKPDGFIIKELSPELFLPAPGQGALAIQVRESDKDIIELVREINDPLTEKTVFCERSLLKLLEGGCHLPLGTYARLNKNRFILKAVIGNPEWSPDSNSPLYSTEVSGSDPRETAKLAFLELKQQMSAYRDYTKQKPVQRIVLTRSQEGNIELMEQLSDLPLEFVDYPILYFAPGIDKNQLAHIKETIISYNWILFTSKTAVRFFYEYFGSTQFPGTIKIGCIGQGTAQIVEQAGYHVEFIPAQNSSEGLLKEFLSLKLPGNPKILIPGPRVGQNHLYTGLKNNGMDAEKLVLYETRIKQPGDIPEFNLRADDLLVFMSPSAVNGFLRYNQIKDQNIIFSIGSTTSASLNNAKLTNTIIEPENSNIDSLIKTIKTFVGKNRYK
ncbi:MAG: hydroxymethylbilane synthase [Candidatus Schekmanbacteria bacterium RBG_13_48_7]|uniref:Porphobilinogen deaminase n=1 Tax=Candidatus Schekmanbacteria bacterium RBG_13_48_7 TaxID=1817878 RepID=A0A1F7RRG8_9BACT|nr:MAG: hydroxymethylbilane synthase [Candidatus Schekmanbacteria bacterium RBG_13_48_7]